MFKHLSGCLAEPLALMFTSFMYTLTFLKERNIINKEQHGFLAAKSTITHLHSGA